MSALDKALQYSKKLNIDECEAVFVKRKVITIRITDSEITEIKQNEEQNFGVRIIHEKKISSAQTRIIENASNAIDDAIKNISFVKRREFWKEFPFETKTKPIENTFDRKLLHIEAAEAADIAQSMINSSLHDKISSISGSLNIVSENFNLANSNDLDCTEDATYISGVINADSIEGDSQVSGIGQESSRTLSGFNPEKVGSDATKMCVDSINPKKCSGDTYSIIFEPYSVGEMLAFVFAPNFNLKTFSEKKSCFSNNFVDKVAVDDFSLIDDPHAPEGIGSKSFDDEGVPTKTISLIEEGVFKNTYSNLYDSFKEGRKSTGNASRPGSPMGRDSEPNPISAPHNLCIISGNSSQEDMIKDTKHGLLVGRLWYTYAVNPIKGDFSCTARSGIRIIENGEIKNPGKPVRIIHNLKNMLQNISHVGNNQKNVLQWASLPSITPSLCVEKIKVIPV